MVQAPLLFHSARITHKVAIRAMYYFVIFYYRSSSLTILGFASYIHLAKKRQYQINTIQWFSYLHNLFDHLHKVLHTCFIYGSLVYIYLGSITFSGQFTMKNLQRLFTHRPKYHNNPHQNDKVY